MLRVEVRQKTDCGLRHTEQESPRIMLNHEYTFTRSDAEHLDDAQGSGRAAARRVATRHPPQRGERDGNSEQRNDQRDQRRTRSVARRIRIGGAGETLQRTQQEKHHTTAN